MFLFWLACHDEQIVTLHDEADSDTDSDSDSDADTDTDTDSDTDSDADTDPTGDTGPTCQGVVSELELFVEARDATGACAVCTGAITLAAGVRNPCEVPISFTGTPACLVPQYRLVGAGDEESGGTDCPDGAVPGPVEVPAFGVVENAFDVGELSSGSWDAIATINAVPAQEIASTFQVQ